MDTEGSQFLQDAKRFVLKNSQIVDITPLQLYASAITFAPKMVITRGNFERELPEWISRDLRVEETWSPELQTLEGLNDLLNQLPSHQTASCWRPALPALVIRPSSSGILPPAPSSIL